MRDSNTCCSPRKNLDNTKKYVHTPADAVDAVFSETTEHHSQTTYVKFAFYFIYTYLLWLKDKKLAVFCVYKLHLKLYIVLSFSGVGSAWEVGGEGGGGSQSCDNDKEQ